MPLVFIAHALGKDPVKRPRNIARVQRWFRFLIDYGPESWSFGIPWLPYALNLDEENYRERGIRDGQAMIKTFDIIALVGGQDTIDSHGAQAERLTMHRLGKGICDLTFMGDEPPDPQRDAIKDHDGKSGIISLSHITRETASALILKHLRIGP